MKELDIPIQILVWFIASGSGLGILIAGLGYGYGQFKKGRKSVDDETILSLQRQLDVLKGEMVEVKKENKELAASNHYLQGQVQTYKEIATLQNPEMKEILKALADTVPLMIENIQYCKAHNQR